MIEFREDSLRSHSGSAVAADVDYSDKVQLSGSSLSQSTAGDDDTAENVQSCDLSSDLSAVTPVNGCFSKALLSGRDELSIDGSMSSFSTTDEHEAERRGMPACIYSRKPHPRFRSTGCITLKPLSFFWCSMLLYIQYYAAE